MGTSPEQVPTADAVLGRLARTQAGVFTRADALEAGVSPGEIRSRVRRGLWIPQFGGALRAATTPDTIDARERAALVRAGEGAALSHFSAARRWRLSVPESAQVWVTVPHRRTPRHSPGLRVVRSRHLPASAVRRVDGVPVLGVARTLVDLARHLDERRLTAVVLEALQRRLCVPDELVAWQRLLASRTGPSALATVLEVADPGFESILAAEFGQLATRAHVPLVPRYGLRLPTGEEVVCDFADLRARIDFEVDGFAFHSTPAQVARDKARDRRLSRAGWLVVRYGTDDIRRRPTETIADMLNQIAARLRTA